MNAVNIGGIWHKVEWVDDLRREFEDGEKQLYGYIDHERCRIQIEQHNDKRVKQASIVHECIHGILHQAGHYDIDRVHEERLAQCLGYGIARLLRDNPDLVKFLTDT